MTLSHRADDSDSTVVTGDPQTRQSVPLRSLRPLPRPRPDSAAHEPCPTRQTPPVSPATPNAYNPVYPEPDQAPTSHGPRHESGDDSVDKRSATPPTTARMSKPAPFLRSSPEYRTLSYGAVSLQDVASAEASQSSAVSDGSAAHDPAQNVTKRRRSDGRGQDAASLAGGLRRLSQDLGGSVVLSGTEGRFGITEGALPIDGLDGGKISEDETAAGSFGANPAIADDDDEDPPDNSPYPQVRASVSPVDNTSLSVNTPRMWTLSTLFSILGSSTNLFFSLRYPSVAITPVIALLLVHPLGLAWDYFLKRQGDPIDEFMEGVRVESPRMSAEFESEEEEEDIRRLVRRTSAERFRLWLAQGRWNEKEHSCVYVSSNVSFGFAFATDVIVEQTKFYNQDVSITYQLLLTLSTQILGYAFAGLTRRFLVRPSGMIWPSTLMSAAMFTTLHKEENKPADGWRITRWNFFYVVFISAFFFYFIPGLLMPALSYFNVITWFAPRNVVVANLFGVVSGLGLFPLTFDWAQIAYIGSPLLTPFWAAMNVVGGLVIVMWIIAPIAYYSNWLYSSYMPILSAAVFDNTGNVYDVSKILTDNFLFDREAYQNYSRVFLPITYVLSYGVQFAGLAALLTHTACWHGRDIWRQWTVSLKEAREESKPSYQPLANSTEGLRRRSSGNGIGPGHLEHRGSGIENLMSREDVHNRLMKRYKDAPLAWYLLTFLVMLATGIFVVEYYPIHLPWYGLLLALGICSILFIPIGIIMAVTNQHSSIYLICQLVCGALFPGRPVANMVFVTYGYISSAQGIKFAADLKLGHYMKVPPRILFSVQMVATIVSSVTQIAVLNWMFGNIPGICTPEAVNGFTCPLARVHFNGSILWGVVGPAEFFGRGATYRPLVWSFLIGAVAPIPLWLYGRNRRDSIVRKINLPVLFGSLSWIPPATGLNFSVWAVVCYVFNYVIKNRAGAWWAKYAMTLSAALDSALASGIVVVFFTFIYPGWMDGFKWWGTEIYKQGCDWNACAYRTVPEGGRFGPDRW